jgi:hypothetical protein
MSDNRSASELIKELRDQIAALPSDKEGFGRDVALSLMDLILERVGAWPPFPASGERPGIEFSLGLYRHYKGGFYTALGLVFHHESRQPMVRYICHETGTESVRSLYGHPGDPDGWKDRVEWEDGGMLPRFCYAGPPGHAEIVRVLLP